MQNSRPLPLKLQGAAPASLWLPAPRPTVGRAWAPVATVLLSDTHVFAQEVAIAAVVGPHRAMRMSSGHATITAPQQACHKCGDHLLMVDSAYGPARNFCQKMLTRCGIATTYYDPLIGEEIARLMRPN